MSQYSSSIRKIYKYKYSNSNQYGDTFRRDKQIPIHVCSISADMNSAQDLAQLIILSDRLQVPIRWDWKSMPQRAAIDIVPMKDLLEVL